MVRALVCFLPFLLHWFTCYSESQIIGNEDFDKKVIAASEAWHGISNQKSFERAFKYTVHHLGTQLTHLQDRWCNTVALPDFTFASVTRAFRLATLMMYKASIVQVSQFAETMGTYSEYNRQSLPSHPLFQAAEIMNEISNLDLTPYGTFSVDNVLKESVEALSKIFEQRAGFSLTDANAKLHFNIQHSMLQSFSHSLVTDLITSHCSESEMNTIISEFQKLSVKYEGKALRQLVGTIDSIYVFVLKASLEDFSKKDEVSEQIILALDVAPGHDNQRSFYTSLIQHTFEDCAKRFKYYINRSGYAKRAHIYLGDRRDIFAIESFFQVTKRLALALKTESPQLKGSKPSMKIYVKGHICVKFVVKQATKAMKGVACASSACTAAMTVLPGAVATTAAGLTVAAVFQAVGTAAKTVLAGNSFIRYIKLRSGRKDKHKSRRSTSLVRSGVNMKNLYAHKEKINLYLRNKNASFKRSWLGAFHDHEVLFVDFAVARWQRAIQDAEEDATKHMIEASASFTEDGQETFASTAAEGAEQFDTFSNFGDFSFF